MDKGLRKQNCNPWLLLTLYYHWHLLTIAAWLDDHDNYTVPFLATIHDSWCTCSSTELHAALPFMKATAIIMFNNNPPLTFILALLIFHCNSKCSTPSHICSPEYSKATQFTRSTNQDWATNHLSHWKTGSGLSSGKWQESIRVLQCPCKNGYQLIKQNRIHLTISDLHRYRSYVTTWYGVLLSQTWMPKSQTSAP